MKAWGYWGLPMIDQSLILLNESCERPPLGADSQMDYSKRSDIAIVETGISVNDVLAQDLLSIRQENDLNQFHRTQ